MQIRNDRLLAVADRIRAFPLHFYMSYWRTGRFCDNSLLCRPEDVQTLLQDADCGTTACIAGHAVLMFGGEVLEITRQFEARHNIGGAPVSDERCAAFILGLSDNVYDVGNSSALFYHSHWRAEFLNLSGIKISDSKFAEVAYLRILFFIATNGTDNEHEFDAERIENRLPHASAVWRALKNIKVKEQQNGE